MTNEASDNLANHIQTIAEKSMTMLKLWARFKGGYYEEFDPAFVSQTLDEIVKLSAYAQNCCWHLQNESNNLAPTFDHITLTPKRIKFDENNENDSDNPAQATTPQQ